MIESRAVGEARGAAALRSRHPHKADPRDCSCEAGGLGAVSKRLAAPSKPMSYAPVQPQRPPADSADGELDAPTLNMTWRELNMNPRDRAF